MRFLLQVTCYKREEKETQETGRRERGREGGGRGRGVERREGGILYIHTYVTELLVMTKEFTSPVEVHTAFTICRKVSEVKERKKERRGGRERTKAEKVMEKGGREEGRGEKEKKERGRRRGRGEGRRRRGGKVGREGGGGEEGGGEEGGG